MTAEKASMVPNLDYWVQVNHLQSAYFAQCTLQPQETCRYTTYNSPVQLVTALLGHMTLDVDFV